MKTFIRFGMTIHLLDNGKFPNLLYLFVKWTKSKEGEGVRYLLHTSQETSAQLEILCAFFSNDENNRVSLSEHSSSNNSAKYLDRIGLTKELKSIFVEKTSKYIVKFRKKYIELSSVSSINQSKLIEQIETLPMKK